MMARRIITTFCLLVVAQSVTAQRPAGALVGTVLHPDGSVIRDAPVRARNEATGTDARTRSSESGQYELLDLPSGTYLLSVNMPCCDFAPYRDENVLVEGGAPLRADISLVLAELSIEGDDPGTVNAQIRARQVIPDLAVPSASDGLPDLSGVWLTSGDPYPEQATALPWAKELFDERVANFTIDHPHTQCLPGSPPVDGAAAFIMKFVQKPDLVVLLFEGAPGFRQVFLDGRAHQQDPNPSWMGHSIGRWEGDTLVIDTIGFNDRGWSGLYPRTEMLRLEERYRRTDYGHLEVRVTFDDPGVFMEPWVRNMTWDLAPQEELIEYVCENNKWGQ